jgi:hypothetical protein
MSAVAGVNGIYVVVDEKGGVFRVDGTQGNRVLVTALKGKAPYSVACGVGNAYESCVIVDSEGSCWRGGARGNGQPFTPVA